MQRPLYLRLSVTDHCNLRCRYCRPNRDAVGQRAAIATDDELLGLMCLIDAEFPLYKVRVTGGEPLLRKDLPQLVTRIRSQMPQVELALTTNAVLLSKAASDLRHAGIDSMNISIDSLETRGFRELTRGGNLSAVLQGIHAAFAAGFAKLRLNTVMMRNVNGNRLAELVLLAARYNSELRFIELMPFGEGAAIYDAEFLSGQEALDSLRQAFDYLGPTEDSATAARYRFLIDGREHVVGFITTVTHPPCERCDRLRLDSHGKIYACLRTPQGVDLLTPYRAGQLDVVRRRIRCEVPNKTIPHGVWPGHSLVLLGG